MRISRPWTRAEEQLLRERGRKVSVVGLARQMKRTPEAVRTRLSALHIYRNGNNHNGNGHGRADGEGGTSTQLGLIVAELIKIHHTLREVIDRNA